MTNAPPRAAPPSVTPDSFAVLPTHAPELIRKHTISVHDPKYVQPLYEDERRRNYQSLVRRYMNQLLYGCDRDFCDTPTCYTARRRLPPNSNPSRRLTLLSARIIAGNLAAQEDPHSQLCPGNPIIPSIARDSKFSEEIAVDDGEKENRRSTPPAKNSGGAKESRERQVVLDKGLKDPRSFTQNLWSTGVMRMIEWIGLPPPVQTRNALQPPQEEQPPKLRFPPSPMEVMDTGQPGDAPPVSQVKHQEILQTPTRRKSAGVKELVTPKHEKGKLGILVPPPPGRERRQYPVTTPSRSGRGDKDATVLESPDVGSRRPQSLNLLNGKLLEELVEMCAVGGINGKDAEKFAEQSVFYVFSKPEALLASFGGVGEGEGVGFDSEAVDKTMELAYQCGWGGLMKRCMWRALGTALLKEAPAKEVAALLVIGLHVLANGLVKEDELFRTVTAVRANGEVSTPQSVMPDIGFEDEIAERLMKRIIRALAFHGRDSDVYRYLRDYIIRVHREAMAKERAELEKEFGSDLGDQAVPRVDSWSFPRCTLEWTRTVFMNHWNGKGFIEPDSLSGECILMFDLLHDSDSLPLDVFQTRIIGRRLDLTVTQAEWLNKTQSQASRYFHLLDYSYLIHHEHLVTIFRTYNLAIMKTAYESVLAQQRLAVQMRRSAKISGPMVSHYVTGPLSTYYVLVIHRNRLMQDTFTQLVHRTASDIRKPLKIRFLDGEEGVDQGGVQQEFFVSLMQEILNPDYGMFVTDTRTQIQWFNESSLEGLQKFEMVGVLIGLALYNGVTLPISFPLAFYLKLLGQEPTLDDIGDFWPELQRGLRDLLSWSDGDVADVFCRTFEYSYTVFDEVRSVNLLSPPFDHLPQPIPKRENRPRVQETTSWGLPNLDARDDEWLGEVLSGLQQGLAQGIGEGRRYTVRVTNLNEVLVEESWEAAQGAEAGTEGVMGQDGETRAQAAERALHDHIQELRRQREAERVREWYPGAVSPTREGSGDRTWDDDDVEARERAWTPTPDEGEQAQGTEEPASPSSSIRPVHLQSGEERDEEPAKSSQPDEEDGAEREGAAGETERLGTSFAETSAGKGDAVKGEHSVEPSGAITEENPQNAAESGKQKTAESDAPVAENPPPVAPETVTEADVPLSSSTLENSQSGGSPEDDRQSKAKPDEEPQKKPSPLLVPAGESESRLSPEPTGLPQPELSSEPESPPEAPLVTNENREEYVRLYLSWLHTRSVHRQFTALQRGLHSVLSARTFSFLTATQLRDMVEGSPTICTRQLERYTKYEDGYDANHPAIRMFWEIVHGFDEEMKRRLLEFVTSSPRVPVGGMSMIMFHIQRCGEDSERVPTSLTCFGRLLLPEYKDIEKMRTKLQIALENARGFGAA